MEEFVKTLRHWYLENRRDLPWRNTRDPYPIWLSEIILQQTRVNQGLPYYHRFLEAFPTVSDLANAPQDKIMRLWQGLGYYSRARNLQAAAKEIVLYHNGKFPADYTSIRALKGVGDYTAAAIASFAYNFPHPVVDGNVYRFLSRLTGNATPIDSSAGKKEFAELAHELLDPHEPGLHNQAMMEIGATVCLPVNPICDDCPFHAACDAYLNNRIQELPVKSKKTAVRKRYFHYFVFVNGDQTYISQRSAGDIWTGLYEFPLVETPGPEKEPVNTLLNQFKGSIKISKEYRHLLSHQKLHAHFYHIKTGKKPPVEFGKLQKVNVGDLDFFAFPQLIVKYLREEKFYPVLSAFLNN
jgi:A/G-specific adenine glycosylase